MATACNKELLNCGKRIIQECERSESELTRIAPGEIEAVAVLLTSTSVSSTANSVPATANSVSATANSVPATANSVPATANSVSSTANSVPATTTSISSTTLQDLPNEILDYILMKAVVKKVLAKKLAKFAWIDYAWRVIQPMRTVWSRWDYSLTTNWFRIVLSRNLNKKNAARMSIAEIKAIPYGDDDMSCRTGFPKLGNQMFLFCGYREGERWVKHFEYCCLLVFEVDDLSHCTKSIPLPLTVAPEGTEACNRSNSIYLWGYSPDVFRVVPDGNDGFEVLRWPHYSPPSNFLDRPDAIGNYYRIDSFSVLDDGNVLVKRCVIAEENRDRCYQYEGEEEEIILSVQTPDGTVIRNTKLPRCCLSSDVLMKSNGNFVYIVLGDGVVKEVDQDGNDIRSFHWISNLAVVEGLFLDSHDRLIVQDRNFDLFVFDDELNFVEEVHIGVPEYCFEDFRSFYNVRFYRETNEIVIAFEYDFVFLVKLRL